MNVYIGEPVVVSDMQGPAPDGFHVPLKTEWEGLKTIMDGLGLTSGDNWRINLHLPFAGYRIYDSANLTAQGSVGLYWSSSPYGSSYPYNSRCLYLSSSNLFANYNSFRTGGFSIRCFKNSFELPTSSWTVINGTLGGAGIFWNQTEGLISITSDGTTGYTIQDKNLGATTVYNNGDTLSQSNCGKYYQWGNNYGFAWTGSVTTSGTKVNAQNYGPGNYYESSTFIKNSNGYWDSSKNDNLRGGVSQGTSTKTQEVQNIYIGEYGWKPGIYQKSDLGLISLSSDGKNWITIADKNIGASNVGDIGSFFQRGNNYQFPTSGFSVSTSQVNTSSYGPNNYYSDSTFRYSNMDWSSPSNLNLRGDTTDTLVARQGPCDSGYHVASATEWNSLLTVLATWSLTQGQYLYNYLKMPYAGYINNTNYNYQFNGQYGFYWSSSSNTNDGTKGGFIQFDSGTIWDNTTSGWWKTLGCKVRPFKNEAVVPDSTWTVIYQPN